MVRSGMLVLCVCVLGMLAAFQRLSAEEFNTVLQIGSAVPAWKGLPGVDGKTHSLSDCADKKLVVVVFTCNSCPVASEYEDRIIALAKKYEKDVAFVAINVNKITEDSMEQMKARAEKKMFPYPYLFDESQQIAKDFGANYTPEFYLLGPDRKIAFMGAMDNHSGAELVTERYLESAIEALLAGNMVAKTAVNPIGCRIRYVRKRRE